MGAPRASWTPVVYLAGPIRDDYASDIGWREDIINCLGNYATCVSPLGGKQYHRNTHTWTLSRWPSSTTAIVRHDAWCVDHADVILANLTALAEEGYPSIGTLLELGRAWGQGKLIYIILDPQYCGHVNATNTLHPFLADIAAIRFDNVAQAVIFLRRHLAVLSGANPHFDGLRDDDGWEDRKEGSS